MERCLLGSARDMWLPLVGHDCDAEGDETQCLASSARSPGEEAKRYRCYWGSRFDEAERTPHLVQDSGFKTIQIPLHRSYNRLWSAIQRLSLWAQLSIQWCFLISLRDGRPRVRCPWCWTYVSRDRRGHQHWPNHKHLARTILPAKNSADGRQECARGTCTIGSNSRNQWVILYRFSCPLLKQETSAFPISLFWFAWTSYKSVHWIVPIIASALWGWSFYTLILMTYTYTEDSYKASRFHLRGRMCEEYPLTDIFWPISSGLQRLRTRRPQPCPQRSGRWLSIIWTADV